MNKKRLISYGYPDVVNELIAQFVLCVDVEYLSKDPGVLLVGSTARGELSWSENEGVIELFSDIEFLVAVDRRNKEKEKSLKQRISSLENDYPLGAHFHIDYVVIPWDKLPNLERKFFVYESKQCGIDLGNVSIRSKLPGVDKSNLSWKELNEVYLHRMNAILAVFPIELLDQKNNAAQRFVLALAKNTLDVTTWLHPYEAGSLVAGFGARLADWENELSGLMLGEYISSNDLDHLKLCLELRRKPHLNVDANRMFDRFLQIYKKAECYCKVANGIDPDAIISNMFVSVKLFNEYCIRRRLRETYKILMALRKLGFKKVIVNIALPRKGVQVRYCFYMLEAAARYMRKDKRCWESLDAATSELNRLLSVEGMSSNDFVTIWSNRRARYEEFCQIIA